MRAAALGLLLLCAGCPSGLEEQQTISKLRVLGVRAEPPELILDADAGTIPATTLTALAVNPRGEPIAVRFAFCTDLSGVPSATLACPGASGIDLPDAGPLAARLELSDPRIVAFAQAAQLDGGAFDAGGLVKTLDEGVPLLYGFTATAGTQESGGFGTITLRTPARGPANVNPELLDLEIGDGGTVAAGEVVRLQPVAAPKDDAAEKYGYSFFATAGEISSLRSTDTTATGGTARTWVDWTAPATAQEVRLWVVLRDGRGGTAWLTRDVQVR